MADYDKGLALGLDAVEHIGKPPRCIGGAELFHNIRLSDYCPMTFSKLIQVS